jgi:hypothetical protein
MIARWTRLGGALLLAVLAAGCGRGIGNISGKVTCNGQPLAGGTITFYDSRNGTASSAIDQEGKYEIPAVCAGAVKVAIAVPLNIPFESPGTSTKAASLPDPSKMVKRNAPFLPPRYLDPEESGLGFEVVRGRQNRDFTLQSP